MYSKVPVSNKAKLKAATAEHAQTFAKSPERITNYSQDDCVKYAS